MDYHNKEVVIVGAGPAGVACAIQLTRYQIDTIVLEKNEIGGLLINANLIENYPGFPNGISGVKYIQLLNKQAHNAKINVKYENVQRVNQIEDVFQIHTDKYKYQSKIVVIASGTKPIIPEIPIISDDIKDSIFFEVKNIRKLKNKNIGIIGAGDCAYDYALALCRNNNVILFNRGKKIKALPILQEKASLSNNISYNENIKIMGIKKIKDSLCLSCDPDRKSIPVNYLLIAIGRNPNLGFINTELLRNQNVFLIGDVNNKLFRQVSIAVGDGIFTAMKINNILKKTV